MCGKGSLSSNQSMNPQRAGAIPLAPQLSNEVTIMKRTLFTAAAALTVLAAAFFMAPSSGADGIAKSKAPIIFNTDVAPILYKNCAECHRPGELAPMSLLSYKDARPWARSIREKVVTRQMPPWSANPHFGSFSNDRRLSQAEIDTIAAWVDEGAIEGNSRDLPTAPSLDDKWAIGKPDTVLSMDKDYELSAQGSDEYINISIPTNFAEDKWVQAVEVHPGDK